MSRMYLKQLISKGTCTKEINNNSSRISGHAVAQLVEVLRYKPEGRGFDPDGVILTFHSHNPPGRTMVQGSTRHLTEISTRNIYWG